LLQNLLKIQAGEGLERCTSISKTAMSFFSLFSPFACLMMKIRQKKGTGFIPFSAFFQRAEKDTKVSFFFLISL
jgi:hypothetical protein